MTTTYDDVEHVTPPADDVREALARVMADHYYIERWSGGEATCTCRQWVESVQRRPYTTWAQHVADALIAAEVRLRGTEIDVETVRVVDRLAMTTGMSAAQVTATILAFTEPSEEAVARGARIIRSVYGDHVDSAESVARSVLRGTVPAEPISDAEEEARVDAAALVIWQDYDQEHGGTDVNDFRAVARAALEAARGARVSAENTTPTNHTNRSL